MAVEALTATARGPLTLSATTKAVRTEQGSVNVVTSTVEMTAAASATSTYLLARLPSNARLHPQSVIGFDDLASTGAPTLDIGTFDLADGTADDDDSINDGIDVATAASSNTRLVKDVANWGKTLWELGGASADPGGFVNVYATLKDAAANTGGTVSASIVYTVD